MSEPVRCTQQIDLVILCQFYFHKRALQTSPIASGRATGNAFGFLTLAEARILCLREARGCAQAGPFIPEIVTNISNDAAVRGAVSPHDKPGRPPVGVSPDAQGGRRRGRQATQQADRTHTSASPWPPECGLALSPSCHSEQPQSVEYLKIRKQSSLPPNSGCEG